MVKFEHVHYKYLYSIMNLYIKQHVENMRIFNTFIIFLSICQ